MLINRKWILCKKKKKLRYAFNHFHSESKFWQELSKFLRQVNCVFIQNGLSWLDTLTSLKNVEDGINEDWMKKCNIVTCSWHQKMKPRIHQFTNLKCCKMSFKMKKQGLKCFWPLSSTLNSRIGEFVVSFFDVTNRLSTYRFSDGFW